MFLLFSLVCPSGTAAEPGLVKNVGVSNYDEPALRQMHQLLPLASNMIRRIVHSPLNS